MTEADSAAMTLLAVRDDAGPFEYLGRQFSCNKAGWFGKAVASPVAVYLLKASKNNQGYGGGLIGVMLAAALAKDDGLSTCFASDLPEPIRKLLDAKGKLGRKDVVIVPRATVSFVKAGGWNNSIHLEAGADKFKISTSLFNMFARPRAMTRMGWDLNKRLQPVAAPVHDMRAPEERAAVTGKPLWIKMLLVAGAIAIVILVIVLRIMAEMH
jgi:hypothetical protein